MRGWLGRWRFFIRPVLFTLTIHGALLALLFVNLSFDREIKRGGVQPIPARAVSEADVQKEIERLNARDKAETQKKKQLADEVAALQKKAAQEKKKLQQAERERKAAEKKRKQAEKKRQQAEAERKAAEKQKAEAERQRQAAEEKRKQAEAKRLEEEKRKAAEAERLRAQTKTSAESALGALVERIAAHVENNWRRPALSPSGLVALIRVKVAPDGRVLAARVVKSSGDQAFDQSALAAVQKASPLPFPSQPQYYEFINEFNFKFNPDAS